MSAILLTFECTVGNKSFKGHDATLKTIPEWLLAAEEYAGIYVVLNSFPLTDAEFAAIDGKLSSMTEDTPAGDVEGCMGGCVEEEAGQAPANAAK